MGIFTELKKKYSRADSKPPETTPENNLAEVDAARFDAFVNALNGFHGETDPMGLTSFLATSTNTISAATADSMYKRNWLTRAVIDTFPEDACREGFDFVCDDAETKEFVENKLEELDLLGNLKDGTVLGRLYGGGLLVAHAIDGQDIKEPLDESRISEVRKLDVLDRYQVGVLRAGPPTLSAANGEIVGYTAAGFPSAIHASRVHRLDGDFLPQRVRDANDGWHASTLDSVYEAIKYFDVAIHSGSLTLQDFVTKILKMPNLANLLAKKNGEQAVRERIQAAFRQLSIFGITAVQNDEEFKKISTPIAGLPNMIDIMIKIAAAASQIPQTRLFGEQLGSLSGADASIRVYHDRARLFQRKRLLPAINWVVGLVLASAEAPARAGGCTWSVKFRSLWQQTQAEEMETRYKQAQIDEIYIRNGVLDPDEVAKSRFGQGDEFNHNTILDEELRADPPDDGGKDDDSQTIPDDVPPTDEGQQPRGAADPPGETAPPVSLNEEDDEDV